MSETTTVGRRIQVRPVGTCWGCGREGVKLYAHRACCRCVEILTTSRGPCPGCGNVRRLTSRGSCKSCCRSLSPASRGRTREYTADELRAAKAREADFVDVIRPAVLRAAWKAFRHWPPHSRDDAVCEALGLAWKDFITLVAAGRDPLAGVDALAKFAVRSVRGWGRVCGRPSLEDALSPRARWEGRVGVRDVDRAGLQRPDGDLLRAQWLDTLGPRARAVAESLSGGDTLEQAVGAFGLTRAEVGRLRAGDWAALG